MRKLSGKKAEPRRGKVVAPVDSVAKEKLVKTFAKQSRDVGRNTRSWAGGREGNQLNEWRPDEEDCQRSRKGRARKKIESAANNIEWLEPPRSHSGLGSAATLTGGGGGNSLRIHEAHAWAGEGGGSTKKPSRKRCVGKRQGTDNCGWGGSEGERTRRGLNTTNKNPFIDCKRKRGTAAGQKANRIRGGETVSRGG